MRIARFVADGDPQFGLVELESDQGQFPDTIAAIDADPLGGPVNYTGERFALDSVRLLAPVIPRSKIVGVGRNYVEHATELGNVVPDEPLLFFKPNTCVVGPDEPIVRPQVTKDLHFEGELAVVIGRICRSVPVERAAEVIFGYTCANDVTARDLQAIDDQWVRAKAFDSFCPLGPWIVTHLSIAEAEDLQVVTSLDGEVKQDESTALMVRKIAELVSYVSNICTLLPGDVILTGTPAGVGPMQPGQQVAVEIDGIGTLANPIIDEQ